MHCAKAFLLIKFMFCLLLNLMWLYPWTLRNAKLTTLFFFSYSPTSLSSFPFDLLKLFHLSHPDGGESCLSHGLLGPVELRCCPPSFPSWPASRCFMRNSACWTLWSGSPEVCCGRYNRALRHQHSYSVFFYLKYTGHQYCCSATWNCVWLLASLNFKNIFSCQLK